MLTLSACVWKRGEEMAGFNARTGLEELEEYAVEHVAADIIVNANEVIIICRGRLSRL